MELGRFVVERSVHDPGGPRYHGWLFGGCAVVGLGAAAVAAWMGVELMAVGTTAVGGFFLSTVAVLAIAEGIGFDVDAKREAGVRPINPVVFVVSPTTLQIEDRGELLLNGLNWRYRGSKLVLTSKGATIEVEQMPRYHREPFLEFLERARAMGQDRHGQGGAEVPSELTGLRAEEAGH